MSKTFPFNPSRTTRGGGAADRGRGGTRGASIVSRSSQAGSRSVGASVPTNRSTSQPSSMSTHNVSTNSTTGSRSRDGGGRMDNSQNPNLDPAGQRKNDEEQGKGQYAGAYTVFSPNEKKRRQINEMAQRETAAYERYKQSQTTQRFNYVGTVGGGELNQDQARARQAQKVRAAKFNRQMREEERKQAARQAEDDAIAVKRADARRKAELNAQRASRVAPVEEVRRNREAFLAQFEKKSPEKDSTSPPPTSTEPSSSPPRRDISGRARGNSNNNTSVRTSVHPRTPPTGVSSSPTKVRGQETASASGRGITRVQGRSQQAHIETKQQVFHNRESPSQVGASQAGPSVKREAKQEREEEFGSPQMN